MASYKNGSITLENVYGKKTYETTIAECSSSIELQELTITENGVYTAPEGTGYSPVNVNVALEENPMQEYVNNRGGDGKPSCYYLFYFYKGTNLDNILKSLDFSKVTNMSSMFYRCSNLTSIPLLDTSKVTDMSYMFYSCYKLTSIPLLDTSEVINMYYMFYSCSNLTSIPLLDTSKVTNMSYMFDSCSNLTSIPLLDTSEVTNMYYMFNRCSNLTSIPLLDTSEVIDMNGMFNNCYNLKEIHMTGMKTSFDISASTKFTESALVEILNNLATVTSTKTLTMSSTNLAKLTDEEKAIATNKGWTLA